VDTEGPTATRDTATAQSNVYCRAIATGAVEWSIDRSDGQREGQAVRGEGSGEW
jgi:hypothetical protein